MGSRATSPELIELGERIRKRRQEMNLSQEALAEKAGISINTVSRVEGGQTAMSIEIFRKMIEIDANGLLGKNVTGSEEKSQIYELICRIQNLSRKDQKIIFQTVDSLIDGICKYR